MLLFGGGKYIKQWNKTERYDIIAQKKGQFIIMITRGGTNEKV